MTERSLLSIDDLHVHYGAIHALKGVSLEVDAGQIVTLIGGNGAGKSTTLRAIHGLLHASSGTVSFAGQDITQRQPYDVAALGVAHVLEGRRLFPRMTVLENLELGAYRRGKGADIAEELDRVFDLFPLLRERQLQEAGTLSGGEQQMCAVGRALMGQPTLLMLDEPSMGLAPQLAERIFETIYRINEQGTTILLVEQNAMMALDLAHWAYVLETGRISVSGPTAEVRRHDQVKRVYLGEG